LELADQLAVAGPAFRSSHAKAQGLGCALLWEVWQSMTYEIQFRCLLQHQCRQVNEVSYETSESLATKGSPFHSQS
jgi:hypothetical protein